MLVSGIQVEKTIVKKWLWQVINHLGSHWDSHFLGENVLVASWWQGGGWAKGQESPTVQRKTACAQPRSGGRLTGLEERCSAPGVHRERWLFWDVWWQGQRRLVSGVGLDLRGDGQPWGGFKLMSLTAGWRLEFGLAATDVRGEVGTGAGTCSISVEQIDDAWGLGPEVSGKEWTIGHEI